MEFLSVVEKRRSIRKFLDKQISDSDLEKILYSGSLAPNAGGGQRTKLLAIQNKEMLDKLGNLNASSMKGVKLSGRAYVSSEQPSIIDNPNIKNGFYNAQTVVAIFSPKDFLYGEADAFCVAENMLLEATNLSLASCVVARGIETFENLYGQSIKEKYNIDQNWICRCFVLLGYIDGPYPKSKHIRDGRIIIVK